MATVENEYYLRSVLLISDGGSYITKKIVHRELPKYGCNLDALLSSNTKKIENEFKKNRKQIEKLFPASGQTDLNTWDIQMLTGIILVLFRSNLEPEEKSQIREIRYVRHELAHSPSAALYEDDYKDVKERLAFAITTLACRFETSVQDHCKELISKYESCSLDVTASLERLKEKQHTDELFEKILEKIKQLDEKLSKDIEESTSQICQTITDTSQETADKIDAVEGGIRTAVANTEQTLSSQIQIAKAAVLEELNRKRQIQPFERIRSIVNSKLTFSGEEEVVDLADKLTLTVINAALKRTQGSTEMERIRRAVDDILEEFDKLEGVKVLSAEPQCIIVGFHCDNYKSLYDLLTYIASQSYQIRLSVIAEAVSSYLHKPLTLHSDMTSACVHSILDEMGTTHSIKRRSILLPIQCDTIEGLENVMKIFESDVLSKKLDKLSDALSEELAGKVSVDAELNEFYIKEDKEIEHTSQQKENDLPIEEHKSLDDECFGDGKELSEDHSYKKERQSLLREQKGLPTQHKNESAKDTSSQERKLIVAAIDVGTTFNYLRVFLRNRLRQRSPQDIHIRRLEECLGNFLFENSNRGSL
ncbi:uncharacterized protein LOC123537567 isoform X2 [Mercenaria mercenaria]|uniref:uncharacterized protein LOC123537567 isoform X2 n=1 Tax=Mercenaria mercenaria TaxID=6596 RepID=UPI00234F882F|nr:uncharacterized protein LOC123537567 isoform X2 [Mercenaria mercenaria]